MEVAALRRPEHEKSAEIPPHLTGWLNQLTLVEPLDRFSKRVREVSSMDEQPQAASNIASTIFADLRRQILRGELPPGERLPGERELAAKYGTNRNTLREAVRKLEQARLVTVRHGQGVTVADFRRTGTMDLLSPFLETAKDLSEVAHILEDILPARLLVIEFATRLASRRADHTDCNRLADITDLLIAAFERGDPVVIAHGFQRWLDALIDAGHSVAIRWIANPFLEAYRDLMDRFPALWVLEPTFPEHLRDFISALKDSDEERAIEVTRAYYRRVDAALMASLGAALAQRSAEPAKPAGSDPHAASNAARTNSGNNSERKRPQRGAPP
jgi:GntR family transcriptional regulator, transcriptional repressor for pyruvate dehydrogenase complex